MERLAGRTTGSRSGAFVVSLVVHATLGAALVLANASSDPAAPGLGAGAHDLIWLSLTSPAGVSSPATAAPPKAARPGSRPVSSKEPQGARPTASRPIADRVAKAAADDHSIVMPVSATGAPQERVPRADEPLESKTRTAIESQDQTGAAAARIASAGPATAAAGTGTASRPTWPGAGIVDRPARPRWPIRPEYPIAARRMGDESMVVVEAWVDDGGDVAFSSILESGGPAFDESALYAVKRAAFRPARLEGRPVPSRVALRIHFALRE